MENILDKFKKLDRGKREQICKHICFGVWIVYVIYSFCDIVAGHEQATQPGGWLNLERKEIRTWIAYCIVEPLYIAIVRDILYCVIDGRYMRDSKKKLSVRFYTVRLVTWPIGWLARYLLLDKVCGTLKVRNNLLNEKKKGGASYGNV